MPSPGPCPDSQPEEMNSSPPSNANSSITGVPSDPSAPTPTPSTPSLSIKIPTFFNLSSIPATLKLSGSLINGHPFSDHDGDEDLVIYSGNAAECPPRAFIIYLDEVKEMDEEEQGEKEEEEEEAQPAELPVESKSGCWPVELRDSSEDTGTLLPNPRNQRRRPFSYSTDQTPFSTTTGAPSPFHYISTLVLGMESERRQGMMVGNTGTDDAHV